MQRNQAKWNWLCLLICFCFGLQANEVSRIEIRHAAQRDLPHFLKNIAPGHEPSFGFVNRKEFKNVRLGRPYRVITVDPEALRRNNPWDSRNFSLLNVWRFPLVCGGKMRSLLTVAKVRGQWQAVAMGASALAKEIQDFEIGLSDDQQVKGRSILRLFQLGVDFLILTESDNPDDLLTGHLTPLTSARRFLPCLHIGAGGTDIKGLMVILKKNHQAFTSHSLRGINE